MNFIVHIVVLCGKIMLTINPQYNPSQIIARGLATISS